MFFSERTVFYSLIECTVKKERKQAEEEAREEKRKYIQMLCIVFVDRLRLEDNKRGIREAFRYSNDLQNKKRRIRKR